jgi:hypothetical protein
MVPEEPLNMLKNVRKVETPTFLLTRIEGRIESREKEFISKKWVMAAFASMLLLMLLNVSVITHYWSSHHKTGAAAVLESMNLSTSNDLYHE